VKTGEVYGTVIVQYGDNCMSQRKIYEWVESFRGVRMALLMRILFGHPL